MECNATERVTHRIPTRDGVGGIQRASGVLQPNETGRWFFEHLDKLHATEELRVIGIEIKTSA